MGIPHLYAHLRPYARPESFPPAAVSPSTPLYIDGPGLAHHVYHLARPAATAAAAANPWESALSYCDFQAAVVAYLDQLTAASFYMYPPPLPAHIPPSHPPSLTPKGSCKIYFDGHLPLSKRPTRLSRLCDSLYRLQAFHSQHPHALPAGTATTYTPSPLSAPPFILAATLEVLSAHASYSHAARTVPGEAESYCARDAIASRGIVLTGDSDLLLFAGGESTWGVMMFRDMHVHDGARVSARVFRPAQVAAGLCVDLTFVGFLAQRDPHATIGTLQARAARIAERRKSGAAVVDEDGKAWREFAAAYVLPREGEHGGRGVEPRIAEIVVQQQQGRGDGAKTMFLPFLWEDPTRGSAWDAGRRIRAAAYSLLFPRGEPVEEVCRRGRRIAAGAVQRVEDPAGLLGGLLRGRDGHDWWIDIALNEITAVFEARDQDPPERALLHGIAHMLSGPSDRAEVAAARAKWTWERIQIYAMAQAVWYSLLLLKEVLSATGSPDGNWHTLPGVAECIDGARFLAGAVVLSKRPGDAEGVKKRKRRKVKKRGGVVGGRSDGNMFSALA